MIRPWGMGFIFFFFAVTAAAEPLLTFEAAARRALEVSPAVARAAADAGLAAQEEPLLLANTDPGFFAGYSHASDRSPRHMPSFQGTYSRAESFQTGFTQSTLTGMQARLAWENQRLRNPSLSRPLDPTADSRLSLEVRQPLLRYFWGRPDKARRRRARAARAAAEAELLRVQTEVVVAAGKAYLIYFGSRESLRLAGESVSTAEKLLKTHREKRPYGLVEDSDVAQAEALFEGRRIEMTLARAEEARARNALLSVLHGQGELPGEAPALAGLPDLAVPPPDQDRAAEASARRPEVLAARSRREAAENALRIAGLDGLPDVAVTGGVAWAGLDGRYPPAWDDLSSGDHPVKSVGLSLSMPLFFKKERLDRRAAVIRLEAARREEADALQRVRQDVRTAGSSLAAARETLAARRRLIEIEKRKLAAEEVNFKRGRSSTDMIVRFQQDVSAARLALVRAEVEEAAARLDWGRSLGLLNEALR